MKNDTRETKLILWVNRIMRWGMGSVLLIYGINNNDESRWIGFILGAAFIITGFFRPKRCIDGSCPID